VRGDLVQSAEANVNVMLLADLPLSHASYNVQMLTSASRGQEWTCAIKRYLGGYTIIYTRSERSPKDDEGGKCNGIIGAVGRVPRSKHASCLFRFRLRRHCTAVENSCGSRRYSGHPLPSPPDNDVECSLILHDDYLLMNES